MLSSVSSHFLILVFELLKRFSEFTRLQERILKWLWEHYCTEWLEKENAEWKKELGGNRLVVSILQSVNVAGVQIEVPSEENIAMSRQEKKVTSTAGMVTQGCFWSFLTI